jgi:hypothetical protein
MMLAALSFLWLCTVRASDISSEYVRVEGQAAAQQEPAAKSEQSAAAERFAAYLAILRGYEAELAGLAWEQEVTLESIPRRGERRQVIFQTSFVVAPDGRWSIRSKRPAPGGEKPALTEERFMFDGKNVLASNPTAKSGLIRGHDSSELHESLISPLMLAAGSNSEPIASPWMHRLSDTFAELKEVSVDESAAPHIRLSGSRLDGDEWERVEVTLDADRGHMPIRILRTTEIFNVLREDLVTTAAEQVGGVWVPAGGTRVLYALYSSDALKAIPKEELAELDKQAQKRIAEDHLDKEKRADREKMGAILRSTYKMAVIMQPRVLGGGKHVLRAWNLRRVSAEDADKTLRSPFEEGFSVTDARTGEHFRYQDGKLISADATQKK